MVSKTQSLILSGAIYFSLSSASAVIPRGTSNICGQKGHDQGNGNYYYSQSSKVNSYTACSAKCAADANCQSFGVGEACMLFNIPLSGNFDVNRASTDTYYDKGCLSSSSTSLAKTPASSSSSQTTSSKSTSSTIPSAASSKTTSSTTKAVDIATISSTSQEVSLKTSTALRTAATSSTTSATSSVTVPSGCPAPSSVALTNLEWFNSTHNLDCPSPNYPSGAEVCFDGTHVCPDATNGVAGGPVVCSCVPYCYTGLPSYAYQPLGYGPPDNITINLSDAAEPSCTAINPTGFRDFEIGTGHVNCGNAQDTIEFYGDSNQDTGSVGRLQYNGYVYNTYTACSGTPQYTGRFPISCTRDAGGNATCGLTEGAATLRLISFI